MSDVVQMGAYKKFVIDSRLRYFKPHASEVLNTFADEVRSGLGSDPKSIPPRFFYDKKGSGLFEQICALPEYYPTRTEISLLRGARGDLSRLGDCRLVELGSGSSVKTRLILDALSCGDLEYSPIDVSDILAESSEGLLADYGNLSITGIIDTYEGGLEFLRGFDGKRNLVAFLGSSLGNLEPAAGSRFLRAVHDALKPGDMLLIGLDLAKDASILESAYNDSAGVTARFNINVLERINCELDADFDLSGFGHRAVYNRGEGRIEMYLESLADQSVTVAGSGLELTLKKGELIHTEYSYKYEKDGVRRMLCDAGFAVTRMWTDPKGYFSLTLASRD